MAVVLGHNQYGKAENRVVRVFRDSDPHEIVDYNVSVALSGDQDAPHLTGDNTPILPTDTQKNTVYAFAKEDDVVGQPESFGIRLARHFVDNTEPIHRARVKVEMYPWARLGNPHAFVRDGRYVRTATVTYDGSTTWVVSGVKDLVVLKTTDAEFWGYIEDRYTTLQPTHDRIVATSLVSQWYHTGEDVDWGKSYDGVLQALQDTFANHHSLALQHTLYEMGAAALENQPEIAEIRFSAPNKHHFVYDLGRFGLENDNEVFHADDRPYGLIEATVRRDDAPDPGLAFDPGQGW
ncbi:factor-independent urate hydroxylase [Geodermatophilus marinus]|uniref:factor-independent urate hydroxylase n=1 Tax=Geodermatophilus sp. LHW52908 TaxID=2303986 RepID=UPI000E3B8687|nr:urate oxidase [Geodermatophilus sp. LHW52908]RFU20493.1 urate oxidase [Geodermatophilus sp. LHW52908]